MTVRKPPPIRAVAASTSSSAALEVLPSKQDELSSIHLDFTSLSDEVVTIRTLLEKVYQEVQGSNIIQEKLIDENKKLKAEIRILRDALTKFGFHLISVD